MITATLGVVLVATIGNPVSILPLNLGQYLYGLIPIISNTEVLMFQEGISSNILVTRRDGQASLRVNGKVDASDGPGDMEAQIALAYFPRFFKSNAEDVLVIGFGSGTTAGASLLFPETRVTCCELEPAVVQAAPIFASINHRPYDSPQFSIINDDARSYLQGTSKSYDIIISEPSNPWMDGVAALYTLEHFQAGRRRLKEGGIYAQWIQTYNIEVDDYALIVRTIAEVFPHLALIRINDGDTLIVAGDLPLTLSSPMIDHIQREIDSLPIVQSDLLHYFQTKNVRTLLLSRFLLGNSELSTLSHFGAGLNTDLNMRLAFDAPRRLFQNLVRPAGDVITEQIEIENIVERFRTWGCGKEQLVVLRTLHQTLSQRQFNRTVGLVELALAVDPLNVGARSDQLSQQMLNTGIVNREAIVALCKESAVEANHIGVLLWQKRKHRMAVSVFEELVKIEPRSIIAWENLATNYEAEGRPDLAAVALREVSRLDPCRPKKVMVSETIVNEAPPAEEK